MAVIINDFQIVPAPPAPAAAQEVVEETPPPAQSSKTREIERILRRQVERKLRVWAH